MKTVVHLDLKFLTGFNLLQNHAASLNNDETYRDTETPITIKDAGNVLSKIGTIGAEDKV